MSDATEISQDHRVFAAISLALAGLSTWEVVVTFRFDWSIITGRRKWRSLMALYFFCRICLIVQVWTAAIYSNAIDEVNCVALGWLTKLAESLGICSSSIILGLRCYSVWGRDKRIGGSLLAIAIGQSGVRAYLDIYWDSYWDTSLAICVSTNMPLNPITYTVFGYTMAFDAIILLLMLRKLFRHPQSDDFRALLLKDGISYFIVSVLANGSATILVALRNNELMMHVALLFATALSSIAATRLIRHTSEYDLLSREQPSTGVASPIAFRTGRSTNGNISQTFALTDMHSHGEGSVGIRMRGQIDMERDAELEHEKKFPRSIQHVLEQSDLDDMETTKSPPL